MTTPRRPSPGDTVRETLFERGEEMGTVKIQDYSTVVSDPKNNFRVGSFLPGDYECSPGDTPKIWPEKEHHAKARAEADILFDQLVTEALADGWSLWERKYR